MGKKISNHPHGSWEWFSDHFIPEPNSGCFLWVRAAGPHYGYVRYDGRTDTAHRVAWRIANSEIPPGMWVLHKCDNGFCVNPRHLFVGTRVDNVRDMIAKGRDVGASTNNRFKTRCPQGHNYDVVEYTPGGVRVRRRCGQCNREYATKRSARFRQRRLLPCS